MTWKKTVFVTLIMATLATASAASAETKGWGAGLGVFDGDFAMQVRKDFWLGGDISQITGQAGVAFASKTTFLLDVDYHFIINPGKPSRFYPLVGLQFGANSDKVKLGVNLGGGFNFRLTEKMGAFAEIKYVAWGFEGLAITGGIYF